MAAGLSSEPLDIGRGGPVGVGAGGQSTCPAHTSGQDTGAEATLGLRQYRCSQNTDNPPNLKNQRRMQN